MTFNIVIYPHAHQRPSKSVDTPGAWRIETSASLIGEKPLYKHCKCLNQGQKVPKQNQLNFKGKMAFLFKKGGYFLLIIFFFSQEFSVNP